MNAMTTAEIPARCDVCRRPSDTMYAVEHFGAPDDGGPPTFEVPLDEVTRRVLRQVGHDIADGAESITIVATRLCADCLPPNAIGGGL